MGTRARLLVVGEPYGLSEVLRDRVLELEARWSRFVDSSEISRLNTAGGRAVPVSPDTQELLARAIRGWEATYGLFDPTILGDLERAGYDRTFERVGGALSPDDPYDDHPPDLDDDLDAVDPDRPDGLGDATGSFRRHPAAEGWSVVDRPGPAHRPGQPRPRSWLVRGCGGLVLDGQAGTAQLPAGVGFDPGGIGKGLAADLVARQAIEAGAAGVLVDLGGDIRVMGQPPERAGQWRIGVDHPTDGTTLATVVLTEGAVATSTRTRRRWTSPDGARRHHLIDPLLGQPVDTDVLSATAVAGEGWQAEVLAKAAFIGGAVQGLGLVDTLGGAALVVESGGGVVEGPGWPRFARRAA